MPPIQLIPGRLVLFTYDKASVIPGGGSGLNDGVLLSCASRNVQYRADLGLWDVEIAQDINGTLYWSHLMLPKPLVAYYPEDTTHNWLSGSHDAVLLGDGFIE